MKTFLIVAISFLLVASNASAQVSTSTVYNVNGMTYISSGSATTGTIDFVKPTPDQVFSVSPGSTFIGLDNFHTDPGNINADALYQKTNPPVADTAFTVILNGVNTNQPLAFFRTSAPQTFDVNGDYGFTSTHTNGGIYDFHGTGLETVAFQSSISGQSGIGGNANYYAQSVTPSAAPEPSQAAALGFFGLGLAAVIVKKRRQLAAS